MHSTKLLLTVGFTMAVTTSAAPLPDPTPSMNPLFEVVSRIPVSTATGVANATAGKSSNHKHIPNCEHNYSANHTSTTNQAHNSSIEGKSDNSEKMGHEATLTGNLSRHPRFNASGYAHPHAVQAHTYTGYNCNHTSQHNATASDGANDEISPPRMLNSSADSSHTHTGYRCAHPSHLNRTTAGHSYDKKSIVREVDLTVCLGADCQDSKVMTADVDSAGQLTGIKAKNSKRIVRRQDTDFAYEDVARQMSGARIAGGV